MNVRKAEQTSNPGYPSLGQFAKSVRQLGLAAVGAGAVGTACAAENVRPPLGGTPPAPSNRVESVSITESQPPRPPGSMSALRLGGKMRPEPSDRAATTNLTASVYIVREGDTLRKIAERFYGGGGDWSAIVKSNPGVDPDHLKIGQKLTIPPTDGRKASHSQ